MNYIGVLKSCVVVVNNVYEAYLKQKEKNFFIRNEGFSNLNLLVVLDKLYLYAPEGKNKIELKKLRNKYLQSQ